MMPSVKIAGLVWAVIFTIALQLVPSLAFAHSGHENHRAAATASALVVSGHHEISAADRDEPVIAARKTGKAQQDEARQVVSTMTDVLSAMSSDDLHTVAPSSTCLGGCCGTGSGCCGVAVIGFPSTLPDIRRVADIITLSYERRAGIDSDTLARPPKPLA